MSRSKRCMTMTLPSGTTLKIPYVADLMSFEHGGMNIRNPMMSDCGRFGVDPKEYGFVEYTTGGSNMALMKQLDNGDYLLLTDDSGTDIPVAEEWATAILGRYTGGGTPYATIALLDIPYESEE